MNSLEISPDALVEKKVFQHLVQDIGLHKTIELMDSMNNEWQKRISNISQAIEERHLDILAAEAATLRSIAQIAGAYKLAELLVKLERAAISKYEEAFLLAQNALNLAVVTRFAYQDVQLAG